MCPEPVKADGCVKAWLKAQEPPFCVKDYLWRQSVQEKALEQ